MKRFLRNTAPFLIVILSITTVRYYFATNENTDKRSFYFDEDRRFSHSVLVIGDSKSQFAFNDSLIALKLGDRFFNLSIWGARPYDNLINSKKIFADSCLILLSISSRVFFDPDTCSTRKTGVSIKEVYNFNLIDKINEAHIANINKDESGRWEYDIQKSGSLEFKYSFRPYGGYERENDSLHFFENIHSSQFGYYKNKKISHLKQLIEKLEKSNNRIMLIDLPERECFTKWSALYERDLFGQIERETGFPVIDFGQYGDECFYDSHHLNTKGARMFSLSLLNKFEKDMGSMPVSNGRLILRQRGAVVNPMAVDLRESYVSSPALRRMMHDTRRSRRDSRSVNR